MPFAYEACERSQLRLAALKNSHPSALRVALPGASHMSLPPATCIGCFVMHKY